VSQSTDIAPHFSHSVWNLFLPEKPLRFLDSFKEWECTTAVRGQEDKLRAGCKKPQLIRAGEHQGRWNGRGVIAAQAPSGPRADLATGRKAHHHVHHQEHHPPVSDSIP